MNVVVPKLGAVVMMAISLMLARCTGSVSSSATATRTGTAIHITAQTQVRVTPTAVTGADGYLWMLGTYPCATGTCPVLMRSADGGKSFARVGTPPAGMYGIEFANRQDGYAYGPDYQGDSSRLYWTDDGGKFWRLVFARFQATVVITGGRAYVLVPENCSTKGLCKSLEVASSLVTSDEWTMRPLPVTAVEAENQFGWTAFGSNVWLLLTWGVNRTRLLVSHDGGRTFSKLTPGGYLGALGCSLTASSPTTLWGFCVTGNGGYAIRSTDGGRDFVNVGYPGGMSNAVQIFPISDTEAIFYPLFGDIWLTRSGGRRFNSLLRVPQNPQYTCQVALVGGTTWLVLGLSEETDEADLMWRTTDGGRSWQPVKAPRV